jgi:hypothetical protein
MNNIREITISRFTASKIIKQYLEEYYSNMVNIKVKTKIENNDLTMIIKKQSKLNGKTILLTEKINQAEITNMIKNYYDNVVDTIFEPYFHNLIIRYYGRISINKKLIKSA